MAETLADTVIALQRGGASAASGPKLSKPGQDFDAGEHTLRIGAGQGLEVFRRVQAALRDQAPSPPRPSGRPLAWRSWIP